MRRLRAAAFLFVLAGSGTSALALDVWLDSVFGPPDTVVGCTAVVRLGAHVHARYPAWGTVFFLLDKDGVRVYEDDETFMLNGEDSLLMDWPLAALEPGYYTARDSLVVDLDPRDSTQVVWKFRVVATAAEERRGDELGRHGTGANLVRGALRMRGSASAVLVDMTGQKVMDLPGPLASGAGGPAGRCDVRHLAPGVYMILASGRAARKVVLVAGDRP